MKNGFYSLFSLSNKTKLDILTQNDLVYLYANAYMRKNKLFLKYSKKSLRLKKLEIIYNDYKSDKTIEKYQYKDIIHSKTFNFIVDTLSDNEVVLYKDGVEKTVKSKDLIIVLVFSNIVAGSPIEIDDHIQNKIDLLKEFLGTHKDVFVLSIKGDSMINKGIEGKDVQKAYRS